MANNASTVLPSIDGNVPRRNVEGIMRHVRKSAVRTAFMSSDPAEWKRRRMRDKMDTHFERPTREITKSKSARRTRVIG